MDPQGIALCAQMSCVLEVACPKPGNVNRYFDFSDTTLEHYLASAVAIGETLRNAAEAGFNHAFKGRYSDIGIGKLIHETVSESQRWHSGGNTNLGIAALLVPLCASYGAAVRVAPEPGDDLVRDVFHSIMSDTTPQDAVDFYKAVREAKPGGLGRHPYLDVNDPRSDEEIIDRNIGLFQVLKISSHDSIARELIDKMRITFEIGSPTILREYNKSGSLRRGILHGYMKILSEVPDSLIVRKKGLQAAKEVSREAERLLKHRLPSEGLRAFDEMLRSKNNALNPGTTADLTVSSLMVSLVKGAKP